MTEEEKLKLIRKQVMLQVVAELLNEQRAELLRRARAKLTAMGIVLGAADEAELS